jgi:multidrug resistance efflux pump
MASMIGFRLRALAVIVIVAGGCGYAVYDSYRAAARPQPLIGMVRRTEIRVAPRISGRLGEIRVRAGASVAAGAVVATLEAPELTAGLVEANAAAASAAADRANIYAGVRQEERAIASSAIETADANVALATEERDRATALAAKGFATGERLDQANANFAATSATLAMKKAAYAEAVAGPTREERGVADSRVADAKASAATTDARLSETRLAAPIDGSVKTVVGDPGEIVRAGQPVVTITAGGAPWFSFTVREDRLGAIAIGAKLKVLRSDGKTTMARVTEFRPLGDFATWQATRAVGDHDLNSFFVRLEPVADDDNDLEPGMTVWLVASSS